MKEAIKKVDQLKTELAGLMPMSSEDKRRLDKKIRLEFNYNSNHLEGNTLTYGETELLLVFDNTTGNHTLREYEEMKAHDVAFKLINTWAEDKERILTEQDIKTLNQIILVRPFWKEAITEDGQSTRRKILIGDYKQFSNSVILPNGEIFHYASPTDTPILMRDLMHWYRKNKDSTHPVKLAALLHYKVVRIHPFDDGNGRVSRQLLNYVLLKNDFPPIIIKSKKKADYLNALHIADAGNLEPFIAFIANQLIWSLETSIKAAKGESVEEDEDFEKELALFERKISRKDKSPKFSEKEVWDILEFFFFPLVQRLTGAINRAQNLFTQREYWSLISKTNDYKGGLHLNSIQRKSTNPQILDFIQNAKSMWFQYKFIDPKNPKIKISEWTFSFHVLFEEKRFKIISPEWTKEFKYGELPMNEERDAIISQAKSSLLEQLNNGLDL